MELPKGSIVVFDRGYISYPWVPDFRGNGRLFRYTAQEERRLQASGTPPCESQNRRHFRPIIEVFSRGKKLCLRRIGYRDPEGGKRYEFLTNHYRFIAKPSPIYIKNAGKSSCSSRKSNKIRASKVLSATRKMPRSSRFTPR